MADAPAPAPAAQDPDADYWAQFDKPAGKAPASKAPPAREGAQEIEVVNPREGALREQTGSLKNGDAAPAAQVVDTQAADNAPTTGRPPAPAADEEQSNPDDSEYWGQFGQPEAAPPKKALPAKPPSLWRRAVDRTGTGSFEALKGLGGTTNQTAGNVNLVGGLIAQSLQAWKTLLTGKMKSFGQDAPTEWQDAWFKNTVDPTIEHAQDFATDDSAPFDAKASHAVGATLAMISQAVLTAGDSAPATALDNVTATGVKSGLEAAGEAAAHGVKAATAPAVSQAITVGKQAYDATGDGKLAVKLALTTYSTNVAMMSMPIAVPGRLATRAATGAGIQGAAAESGREINNAMIPDDMSDADKRTLPDDKLAAQNQYEHGADTLRQEFKPEDAIMNLIQGSLFGAIAGPRPAPHPLAEEHTTAMEHAQAVAAADVRAKGGDMLDQVVAATDVNAHVGAVHDAAEYHGNMEVRNQQMAQEAEIQRQEEERAAKEQAPGQAYAAKDRAAEDQKDADYTAALNQKGDQAIERGDTLAVGAEKGAEGTKAPTLADTLKPEEVTAFKTLAERRAAEMRQEPPKAEGEDKFTPYVEPLKKGELAPGVRVLPADEKGPSVMGKTTKAQRDAVEYSPSPETEPLLNPPAEKTLGDRRAEARMGNPEEEPLLNEKPPETLQERRSRMQAPELPPETVPPKENGEQAPHLPTQEEVDAAAHEAATSPKNDLPTPTEAEQNAGNFKMGHVEVHGMPITIEHPEGSTRPSGTKMVDHYGYFKGTEGADGQHVDVIVGKKPEADNAFIVDHLGGDGSFEQHKVLMGFPNKLAAMRSYRAAFPDRPLGPVSEVKVDALKDWLANGDTTKPFDQKGVNRLQDSRGPKFADSKRPEGVPVEHKVEGTEHSVKSAHGMTIADTLPNGDIRIAHTGTSPGMRGQGEAFARHEHLAGIAHAGGKKLVSGEEVSEPAQHIYDKFRREGYDVKENPNRVDGQGRKISASDLKPVYEVGPKKPSFRDTTEPTPARVTKEHVNAALKPLTDRVGTDGIQVHDDHTTLPDHIKQDMVDYNHPNPVGVYDSKTDTVHIIAGNHESADDAMRTVVHEIVGHKGLRHLLGDDLGPVTHDIWKNATSKAKAWMKDYMAQHSFDPANRGDQAKAAEEYAAHLAEDQAENPGVLKQMHDAIRAGLRKLGLVREWTDADINRLLRKSAANLESEHARAGADYKGDGPRFADKEDTGVERLHPENPLAVAHKFGRTMEQQANYNPGFVRSRMDWVRDKMENTIDARMAFIGLRNIPDFMSEKLMPSLRAFIRTHDQMDGRRGALMTEAADLARDWSGYVSKNKKAGAALGELMHASTLGGVDPSKPFEARYTDAAKARDATMQAHEDMRQDLHGKLKDIYNRVLDSKGRAMYQTVRDRYTANRQMVFDALEKRVMESAADNNTKKSIMTQLRQKFESGKVQGPYFPLARFGDHWASAKDKDGNTVSFSRFESQSQKKAWIAEAQKRGFATDGGQRMDDKSLMERIDPQFVQKVTDMAKEVDPNLADEIWQAYLKAMPEMSMRKHFIHRVGRLGYSMDAMRAFAYNSFHGAHQLARLEYGNRLDTHLDNIKTEARTVESTDPTSKDAAWAPALAREMARRYDWIKNPRSSPLASALTKFGFGWYLGAAPATAFRIFSQNPMLAQPMLGKYHGQLGATKELSRASAQWAMSKGNLGDKLRGDERRAFDTAAEMGVFSNTNTQMLANGGAGEPMFTGAYYHAQVAMGYLFNAMEHHNRMTTYLAAYRLGKMQGMSHDAAVNHATDLTWDAHFDYTNANRPRVLQNDFAKVALLFKQYSWGVTYRLAREARDMFNKDLTPVQNVQARKAFAGLLTRGMMFAGVTGLPLSWVAEGVINAVMGDKDQPFDSKAAAHKILSDSMGQTAADAVMTGPVGAITGASLSGGASYNDLWYRPPSREETPPEQWSDLMGTLGGAIPAIGTNVATGAMMMHDGQTERGFEHFVPPEAAALMKAIRYSKEGVQNLAGETVISRDELDNRDLFLQAIGFTPQKVADAYARNTALKNVSKVIMDRRSQLENRVAVAASMGDDDEISGAMDDIDAFNTRNPGVMIPGKAIVSSMYNRYKNQAEAVNGVKLPPGLGGLYDQYGASQSETQK